MCDSNFRKTEDVDKSVEKVLKMFSEHFVKKMAPLNEESDMECVYVYDNLTPEKVRLLKRLLNHNKTLLNFKEILISKPGGSSSDSASIRSDSLTPSDSTLNSFHSSDAGSDSPSSISFRNPSSRSEVARKLREVAKTLEELADDL